MPKPLDMTEEELEQRKKKKRKKKFEKRLKKSKLKLIVPNKQQRQCSWELTCLVIQVNQERRLEDDRRFTGTMIKKPNPSSRVAKMASINSSLIRMATVAIVKLKWRVINGKI